MRRSSWEGSGLMSVSRIDFEAGKWRVGENVWSGKGHVGWV